MFEGVDPIFIIPPALLVVVALAAGLRKLSTGGYKSAALAVFRVLFYGGFILFLLFIAWIALYYAGGGH